MIESSLLTPSLVNDLYPDWPFPDIIGSDDYAFKYDSMDFLNTYDSISSNSSDIDAFNLEDFEDYSTLSDDFVSQIVGDDLYSTFSQVDNYNQSPSNLNKSNVTSSKKKRSAYSQQAVKSWSNMSAEEQNKTLLEISDATCRMGISDQIEVIRIMKPGVEISAEMTEFTLDTSLLNDTKLKKIQEYLKRTKQRPVKSRKPSKARKSSSSVSRTSKKPRPKKEKNFSETEEFKKLKRKQQRQGRKEEKSGLFVYEKVVKFSSLEEDEDVNILE